jgi:hypothetical protein
MPFAWTGRFSAMAEGNPKDSHVYSTIRQDIHSTPSGSHLFVHGDCYKHATLRVADFRKHNRYCARRRRHREARSRPGVNCWIASLRLQGRGAVFPSGSLLPHGKPCAGIPRSPLLWRGAGGEVSRNDGAANVRTAARPCKRGLDCGLRRHPR